jgi:acetylornithine deacetylase/succinyl-diaminopimelate desuccinylase-like protein
VAGASDLSEKIMIAQSDLSKIFSKYLSLKSPEGWQSQVKFPFISVGTPGIYNITAGQGCLGVEIRPIPQDDLEGLQSEVEAYCSNNGLEATFNIVEPGVACDPKNIALMSLVEAVRKTAQGVEPRLGKKLPATSARFAPGGRGIVWGQTGLAPHAKDERHYIPSIMPYYQALMELGRNWI